MVELFAINWNKRTKIRPFSQPNLKVRLPPWIQQKPHFHSKLPQATAAINRLFQEGAHWLVERDCKRLLTIIHPSERTDNLQMSIADLAVKSTDAIDFKLPAPRPCPWLSLQPLTDTPIKDFSKERKNTMEMVCQLTEELSDKAIQILDKLESADLSFKPPTFRLESDRKTPEQLAEESSADPEILKWTQPLNLDDRFQELMKQRAQLKHAAGLRPDDPIRPDELQILAHSLDLTVEQTLELANRHRQDETTVK